MYSTTPPFFLIAFTPEQKTRPGEAVGNCHTRRRTQRLVRRARGGLAALSRLSRETVDLLAIDYAVFHLAFAFHLGEYGGHLSFQPSVLDPAKSQPTARFPLRYQWHSSQGPL